MFGCDAVYPGLRPGQRRREGLLGLLGLLLLSVAALIKIDPKDIKVNLERQQNLDVLEVKIELPEAR